MYPREKVVNLLNGVTTDQLQVFSKKTGNYDNVRLVKDGSAMTNLLDEKDKKDWYGIFNHVLLVTRYATHLACELEKKGLVIDPQLVLESTLVSHIGRRQWDEAQWYDQALPLVVGKKEANIRKNKTSEELSIRLLDQEIKNNKDKDILSIREYVNDLWLYKKENFIAMLSLYVDCRTSQQFELMSERVSRMIYLDLIPNELKNDGMRPIVENYINRVIKNNLSISEATQEAKKIGIKEKGDRLSLDIVLKMLTISIEIEKKLNDAEINTKLENIIAPGWENNLRKKYQNYLYTIA